MIILIALVLAPVVFILGMCAGYAITRHHE